MGKVNECEINNSANFYISFNDLLAYTFNLQTGIWHAKLLQVLKFTHSSRE